MVYFGVANTDGCSSCDVPLCNCLGTPSPTPEFDAQGRRIFEQASGRFLIVIEAKPGTSGAAVGTSLQPPQPLPDPLTTLPDLQIESSQPLGNGSPAVCDKVGPASQQGGVPGFLIPDFVSQDAIDALWDFACRFTAQLPSSPCTLDANGNQSLVNRLANPTVQFCDLVAASSVFPNGDSVVTVQLRDVQQHIGPTAQIVVRVLTPTPNL